MYFGIRRGPETNMRKLFSYRSSLLFIAAAIAVTAFACGGGGDDPATATSAPAATSTATSAPATATPSGLVGDVARGETAFVAETCSGCHSTSDTQIVGPGLKDVSVRAAALGGDAYLIESMKDPGAVVVEGFAPIMSSFAHLDDQTIADLVAYLNTLK